MKIPAPNFSEEYIDDPHWNSGFWETTVSFPGGISFKMSGRINEVCIETIEKCYEEKAFELYWKQEMPRLREKVNNFWERNVFPRSSGSSPQSESKILEKTS